MVSVVSFTKNFLTLNPQTKRHLEEFRFTRKARFLSGFFVFFRVFWCWWRVQAPVEKNVKTQKQKKSRPVVERWWGSLILWWLQNEKVEKMRVRGCVTCIRERVYVLKKSNTAKKMNMELSNVRKWLVYFREMIQWAQKNTLTDAFIVQAIIFGDVYTVYIPPKKTGITKPTLRNFGRPTVRGYQIYSPKWYPRSTPWCPKVASSGLVQESISCPGTYACWFKGKKLIKRPLISLTYLGPSYKSFFINLNSLPFFCPLAIFFGLGRMFFFYSSVYPFPPIHSPTHHILRQRWRINHF